MYDYATQVKTGSKSSSTTDHRLVRGKSLWRTLSNLVYSASGAEVDNVIVNGRMVMDDGAFPHIDEASLMDEANSRAERIFADAEEDWRNADSMLVRHVDEGWL